MPAVGLRPRMTEYDDLADLYDRTRGGEPRGDQYAADVHALLSPAGGPVLEIGVGTGVVALGLQRRGRAVVGLDASAPMLARARGRLGDVVVQADAGHMAVATSSFDHAVSVWVLHAVADPVLLLREVHRVLRPGGRYVVATTQRSAPEDRVGMIIDAMAAVVDAHRVGARSRTVVADDVLHWADPLGFLGTVQPVTRSWRSTAAAEIAAIGEQAWPALRDLDEPTLEAATRPALEALGALPAGEHVRRAVAELVVLERP